MEQPNVEPEIQAPAAVADGVAVAHAGTAPATGADAARDDARNRRRVKQGVVRSDKMDKTIVVVTETRVPHPTYKKIVRKSVRFKAHDEKNEAKTGDTVRIMEMRPMSRDKRWRLLEIVERAR
jgi:small subunit ribosomal protein S17